jgi:ABC-type cobalt transport system substrate-binding protein
MQSQSDRHAQQRHNIAHRVIPATIGLFFQKNEDYGSGSDEFGAKAQVIDIGRKYKKIKAAIWDGVELEGEGLEEVCKDMIGHLLILLESMTEEPDGVPIPFTFGDWYNHYLSAMQKMRDQNRPFDG